MTTPAARPSARRFSIAQVALIIPWVALVIDAWSPIRDNSFLWHVRAGTLQIELGEVLTRDPFSFTMGGQPWLTQSWLAELLYGWAERATGLGFVPWMLLTTTTLTFLALGLIAFRQSGSATATAFVLILSTLLLISFLVPRPVIFSFLLFGMVILAWDDPRLRWAIPFLFWIWASVHGSFAIGLAYVGLRIITRREWRALPLAVIGGLATLTTAHGLGVVEILTDFNEARDTLPLLSEWRRPSLASPVFLSFLGGVAFIVIGAYRQRVHLVHLWTIVPFLLLGFSSLRAVPPAWFGLVPVVAIALGGLTLGSKDRLGLGPAFVFGVVVLLFPFLIRGEAEVDEERFPIEARNFLDPQRTFHDDRVGGYLIWADWPDHLVYLDDRAELYTGRMAEFVSIRDGETDWEPIFERDGIEQALLRSDELLVEELVGAGWQAIYEDEAYIVLRE